MRVLPKSVEKVIEEFEKLPGIGPKSAARMAYYFLRAPKERSEALAQALTEMKSATVTCTSCFNVADSDPCKICASPDRLRKSICVVEEPLDVVAIERSGVYAGVYFVLGGVISPADGIGPEQLRMTELKQRVKEMTEAVEGGANTVEDSSEDEDSIEKTLEVIVATNPNLEGEATASYVAEMIEEINDKVDESSAKMKVSRLAMGLPTGADLEYADRLTLKRALDGRTEVTKK